MGTGAQSQATVQDGGGGDGSFSITLPGPGTYQVTVIIHRMNHMYHLNTQAVATVTIAPTCFGATGGAGGAGGTGGTGGTSGTALELAGE